MLKDPFQMPLQTKQNNPPSTILLLAKGGKRDDVRRTIKESDAQVEPVLPKIRGKELL